MTSDTDALCAKLTCTHRALTKVDSTTRNESRTCYLPTCRQYRARTASPRPDLGMRGWTAAPHQESPSAASRQAFCRRGARRRNQACEKVRTERYRYAAPPDAYPCASIPCIGHSSRCRNLTLSRWRHFGRPVTQKKSTVATCFYGTIRTTSTMGHSPKLGDGPLGHPGA